MCILTCHRRYTSEITVWCDHLDPKVVKAVDSYWKGLAVVMAHPIKDRVTNKMEAAGKIVSIKSPSFVALMEACRSWGVEDPTRQKGESEKKFKQRKALYCGAIRTLVTRYNEDCRLRMDHDRKTTARTFTTQAREVAAGIFAAYEELNANFQAQEEYLRNAPKPW